MGKGRGSLNLIEFTNSHQMNIRVYIYIFAYTHLHIDAYPLFYLDIKKIFKT
jgi:hypothetical protein